MSDRPSLWEVMHAAGSNALGEPRDAIAAEIRALRDWLVPEEEGLADGFGVIRRGERQRLRALLTAEAELAELGGNA